MYHENRSEVFPHNVNFRTLLYMKYINDTAWQHLYCMSLQFFVLKVSYMTYMPTVCIIWMSYTRMGNSQVMEWQKRVSQTVLYSYLRFSGWVELKSHGPRVSLHTRAEENMTGIRMELRRHLLTHGLISRDQDKLQYTVLLQNAFKT